MNFDCGPDDVCETQYGPRRPWAAPSKVEHLIQGEHAVSADGDVVMAATLGSCVATCIFDPVAGIGGMNHILLPARDTDESGYGTLYSVNLMELVINALMRVGANRARLRCKLFGGAHIASFNWEIGRRNIEFAEGFLSRESIPCVGGSVGGDRGRRLQFWPTSGRARQSFLDKVKPEAVRGSGGPPRRSGGEVELFLRKTGEKS